MDSEITTFEETLDELLQRRRALARDMLCSAPDLSSADFENILKGLKHSFFKQQKDVSIHITSKSCC
jgi:hypothetical protein